MHKNKGQIHKGLNLSALHYRWQKKGNRKERETEGKDREGKKVERERKVDITTPLL